MTFQTAPLKREIAETGFAFVPGERMRRLLEATGSLADWDRFAASWNDLALDTFMADGGRYRRRRHAVFAVDRAGSIVRKPHQPHFQTRNFNPLNGGIERWFEPVTDAVAAGATMTTALRLCAGCFAALSPEVQSWHVEAHQFRIEANAAMMGKPTPEGMHRDGVDHVLVLLIKRQNIVSGTTTIADLEQQPLGSFTLTDPLDAAFVDDHRVYHGVTPVLPENPEAPAYRDVLVVTFKRER